MRIGAHEIGPGHPVFVVAELGINHNGSLDQALAMVRAAARAGVDAVKVQAFHPACFVAPGATWKGESQADMFARYVLPDESSAVIAEECRRNGVEFFGTPDCEHHARVLVDAGAVAIKIGSDDLTNTPLIRAFAKMGLPMILSTGMGTQDEIMDGLRAAADCPREPYEHPDVAVLACTSHYPTHWDEADLWRIGWLKLQADWLIVGYSDHTDTLNIPSLAVACGAQIIERHITLDRNATGPDHNFSADPTQLAEIVRRIRNAESACNFGPRQAWGVDADMRAVARRSIVAARSTARGTVLTAEHLAYKRTGKEGLRPSDNSMVIGRRLARDVKENEMLSEADLV